MAWNVSAHDNEHYFFTASSSVHRCERCGELLDKWTTRLTDVSLRKRKLLDFSSTYDGVLVASEKFRKAYGNLGGQGLEIEPLCDGFYTVQATRCVRFDPARARTRFINRCELCGNYAEVIGAEPFFGEADTLRPTEFARTDLEFASRDEKHPLLICGNLVGETLAKARLRGLVLHEIPPSAWTQGE